MAMFKLLALPLTLTLGACYIKSVARRNRMKERARTLKMGQKIVTGFVMKKWRSLDAKLGFEKVGY